MDMLQELMDMTEPEKAAKEAPIEKPKEAVTQINLDLLASKMAEVIGLKAKQELISEVRKMQGKVD